MSTQTSINVEKVIDEGRFNPYRALVVVSCLLVAMGDGFDAQALAYVAPDIAREWSIDSMVLGPLFAVSLAGLMAGSLILGPLADHVGRRIVLLGSFFTVGVFALLTSTAQSVEHLAIYRFLTGIGLGGTVPNIVALTAEYSPKRWRTTIVTLMSAGFPLGAFLGGLLIGEVVSEWGWRGVFIFGGTMPIVICIALAFVLPESLGILVRRPGARDQARAILLKLDKSLHLPQDVTFVQPGNASSSGRTSVRMLFVAPFLGSTLLIWVAVFFNLLVTYFMLNWLPTILTASGASLEQAIKGATLFNFGGILGGIALARLADRFGASTVLAFAYAVSALLVGSIGLVSISNLQFTLIFLAGAGVLGTQLCIYGLLAGLYPTYLRATGVGWALGIGRLGSIVGPLVGSWLLAVGLAPQQAFSFAGIPILACLVAVLMLQLKSGPRGVPQDHAPE